MNVITPSQTIGPFAAPCLTPNEQGKTNYPWQQLINGNLVTPDAVGERIRIEGRMFDREGAPIDGTLFEIWQANSHGRYNHPDDRRNLALDAGFEVYGRASTFTDGIAHFSTVKPGRVPWPAGGMQAPHINVAIFMRGLMKQLVTRIDFEGEPGNAQAETLASVPAVKNAFSTHARRESAGTASPNRNSAR